MLYKCATQECRVMLQKPGTKHNELPTNKAVPGEYVAELSTMNFTFSCTSLPSPVSQFLEHPVNKLLRDWAHSAWEHLQK